MKTFSGNRTDRIRAPQGAARLLGGAAWTGGIPLGFALVSRQVAVLLVSAEVGVALTVVATALFGSRVLSERAFRILRWFANREEPPSPGG